MSSQLPRRRPSGMPAVEWYKTTDIALIVERYNDGVLLTLAEARQQILGGESVQDAIGAVMHHVKAGTRYDNAQEAVDAVLAALGVDEGSTE